MIDLNLKIKTINGEEKDVISNCFQAVEETLNKMGVKHELSCEDNSTKKVQPGETPSESPESPCKLVCDGLMNFSFGKNGLGLTDELLKIGEIVKNLSQDNYVYIEDTFIDAVDDVYDIKLRVIPHEENSYMLKKSTTHD